VILSVQTATDLTNSTTWTALPNTYSVTEQDPVGDGTAIITITGPAATETQRYFRLLLTPR
jgi:hypothetical protein